MRVDGFWSTSRLDCFGCLRDCLFTIRGLADDRYSAFCSEKCTNPATNNFVIIDQQYTNGVYAHAC